jgi:hypothetical protein
MEWRQAEWNLDVLESLFDFYLSNRPVPKRNGTLSTRSFSMLESPH